MINTFFAGDSHCYHKKIMEFEPDFRPFSSVEEHNEILIENHNGIVKPNDIVWHLGDVIFGCVENIEIISRFNGKKKLVLGNHDKSKVDDLRKYMDYFTHIYGVASYKGFVLTHIPVHPSQFCRYKGNIHGHVHSNTLDDPRYINVSMEAINLTPIPYDEILNRWAANN